MAAGLAIHSRTRRMRSRASPPSPSPAEAAALPTSKFSSGSAVPHYFSPPAVHSTARTLHLGRLPCARAHRHSPPLRDMEAWWHRRASTDFFPGSSPAAAMGVHMDRSSANTGVHPRLFLGAHETNQRGHRSPLTSSRGVRQTLPWKSTWVGAPARSRGRSLTTAVTENVHVCAFVSESGVHFVQSTKFTS